MVETVKTGRERFPWIYADLESALSGAPARFKPPVHHCPQCGRDYLCSDRYTQDFCSPQKQFPGNNEWSCSPCLGGDIYDDETRDAWWLAHGIIAKNAGKD
jgi:hypothetical protein